MNELVKDTVESSELVEQTFQFWFTDKGHIRSPFPSYIQPELKRLATDRFFNWSSNLKDDAKDEMNDEMVGERFEEIIFETATELIKTEDERITILYPFLPRVGDQLTNEKGEQGKVVDRHIRKEKDHSYLQVKCENDADAQTWNTSFELPL